MFVTTQSGDDQLLLTDVRWEQALGRPFRGSITLLSDSDTAPDLLGQPLSVCIDGDSSAYFHGYITEFELGEQRDGETKFYATLAPWFSLLKEAGGSKIYQQQSVVDIFKAIAEQRGFSGQVEDKLSGTYRVRPFCVQYQESEFNFLSRLLEEEGIYYYFDYAADSHTMVLADDISAHQAVPEFETLSYFDGDNIAKSPRVYGLQAAVVYGTSSFILKDYDFQKPRAEMTVRQDSALEYCDSAWYQYPGRFFETSDGQTYARVRSEAAVANQKMISVRTNIPAARAGALLSIDSHPVDEVNIEYLITKFNLQTSSPGFAAGGVPAADFACQLELQDTEIPFRTRPQAVKPLAAGPHLATVVGIDGDEIWTDAYGRIKVQFAWDLDGDNTDASSCWMRVVQPWTGKGYGAISIPRIGEEVIVQFIDGDIDRPIVTGSVHNADRMPPETLADAQAKTIFRTRSTKGGDVDAFHELTFDDTKDAESIYFHSERDFDRVVENNDSLKVGFDKQSPGDQSIEVYNNQDIKIGVGSGGGSQTVEIAQDREITLDSGSDSLAIKQGDQSVEIEQGDQNIKVDQGAITIEAGKSITLKCGQSQIEITPSGITIQASDVNVNGQSSVNLSAPTVKGAADGALQLSGNTEASVQSSAQLVLKGAIVQIN